MKFTFKQQRFIDSYNGNATEAAINANYSPKSADVQGVRLLRNARIVEAIQSRVKKEYSSKIAEREELQEFWSEIMRGIKAHMEHRLKASEYLARSQAVFVENIKHSGEVVMKVEAQDLDERRLVFSRLNGSVN